MRSLRRYRVDRSESGFPRRARWRGGLHRAFTQGAKRRGGEAVWIAVAAATFLASRQNDLFLRLRLHGRWKAAGKVRDRRTRLPGREMRALRLTGNFRG